MKGLSIVGTAAMFMVGGGILVHGIAPLHHAIEDVAHRVAAVPAIGGVMHAITPTLLDALVGIAAGALVLMLVTMGTRVFRTAKA
jgi:predicted DNA repair protein MutK